MAFGWRATGARGWCVCGFAGGARAPTRIDRSDTFDYACGESLTLFAVIPG